MRITPLDIQQQNFKKSFHGYDAKEVKAFLDLVADELESLLRDHLQLKDELRRKENELLNIQQREKMIKDTLITAQKITSQIKDGAEKESEVIVGRAELQAEKIINVAYQRLAKLTDDIHELKQQRARLESGIKAVADSHLKLLESMSETRKQEQTPEQTIRIMQKSS